MVDITVIPGTLTKHGLHGAQYIIPIRGLEGKLLPLPMVEYFCKVFVKFAANRSNDYFKISVIGCGKREYKPKQIAPFFDYSPPNVTLPYEFIY